jgi:pilus assembly protein CpaE
MITCVLVSAEESFQRQVKSLMRKPESSASLALELAQSASTLSREQVSHILAEEPQLIFVDLGDSTTGLRVLEALSQEAPDVPLIVAGPVLPADALLKVIRAGGTEYLPRPLHPDDTTSAFQRVRRRLGTIRLETPVKRGELTTVFSPKGGVGVTTVSVNLALALRQLTGKEVLLVDLSPSLGTAALTMGLQPRYSYLDVIQNFHRIDDELFQSFLDVHESGVHVLASPPRVEDQNGPSADDVLGVFRHCRRHFAHVVVDGGHSLTSAVDTAFMESEHRLLVATPELPTLRNLKRALETVGGPVSNGKPPVRLVLNQFAEGVGMALQDVEQGLGLGVHAVIQRDAGLATESINLGRPAVLAGRSEFRKAVQGLAKEIAGPDQVVAERQGLLKTLMRPFRPNAAAAAL